MSAALGELAGGRAAEGLPVPVRWVKVGLAGERFRADWPARLGRVAEAHRPAGLIAVAYADAWRVGAPAPREVLAWARRRGVVGLLVDTAVKDGRTLRAHAAAAGVPGLVREAKRLGLLVAVGGSLTAEDVGWVGQWAPDIFAVRGAACAGSRDGRIQAPRVRALAQRLEEA